jgi:hypothetical protein
VYDFFVTTFQVWKETLDFRFVPAVDALAQKARFVLRFDADRLHPRAGLRHGPALLDAPLRGGRSRTSSSCR